MTDTPYTPEDLSEAETPTRTGTPAIKDDTNGPASRETSRISETRKDELLESDLENTLCARDAPKRRRGPLAPAQFV